MSIDRAARSGSRPASGIRPGLVVARVRGRRSWTYHDQGARPGLHGDDPRRVAVRRGRRRRDEHHDVRRDARRPPAVARLRHRPLSGASFESTSISSRDDELVVEGDLNDQGRHEVGRSMAAFVGEAADPWGNDRIGLELETTVDRTDFALTERPAPRRLPAAERGRTESQFRGEGS